MPTIDLNARVLSSLRCPPGKSEIVYWCKSMPGFGLRIRDTDARSWLVQARVKSGATRRITIGDPRTVPFGQARDRARELLAEIGLHGDPMARLRQERQESATTVRAVMERYVDFKKPRLRPSSYSDLQHYLLKLSRSLHDRPIAAVVRQDVAAVLDKVAENAPIAANRLRANLHAFWVWSMRSGITTTNPVSHTFLPTVERARERVLSPAEVVLIWQATAEGSDYSRIVRLLLLSGARREEIAAMRWSELTRNEDGSATWLLPSARAKNLLPNERVLPALATAQLPKPQQDHDGNPIPALFGKQESGFSGFSHAKLRLDTRIAGLRGPDAAPVPGWRLHDLRRVFVTGLNDLGVEPHVVEALVGHVGFARKNVAGVYNKSAYSAPKREALKLWANHVARLVGESVVKLHEAG
jgi:integrase